MEVGCDGGLQCRRWGPKGWPSGVTGGAGERENEIEEMGETMGSGVRWRAGAECGMLG